MMRSYFSFVFFLCLGVLAGSCDQFNKLTATKIKDILERPRDYENKEVTVHGTVTESASILIAKYFVLQDSTGSIKVAPKKIDMSSAVANSQRKTHPDTGPNIERNGKSGEKSLVSQLLPDI